MIGIKINHGDNRKSETKVIIIKRIKSASLLLLLFPTDPTVSTWPVLESILL